MSAAPVSVGDSPAARRNDGSVREDCDLLKQCLADNKAPTENVGGQARQPRFASVLAAPIDQTGRRLAGGKRPQIGNDLRHRLG